MRIVSGAGPAFTQTTLGWRVTRTTAFISLSRVARASFAWAGLFLGERIRTLGQPTGPALYLTLDG